MTSEDPVPAAMSQAAFRDELRTRLTTRKDQAVLTIIPVGHPDRPADLSGSALLERADDLVARHVTGAPGVTLLLLPHCVELFALHVGLVLQGHCPAILAWQTTRVDPQKYHRNLIHQLRSLAADRLVTLPELAEVLAPHLPYPVSACGIAGASGTVPARFDVSMGGAPTSRAPAALQTPRRDALFLQFSGGTTGSQKAVAITAAMLVAQLDSLAATLVFSPRDCVVSWLPMYHDMGLIACLWLPLWHGARSVQFAASDWIVDPESLFRHVQRYGATFCWLPNFAFAYMAQQRARFTGSYALDEMRGWINCSEPVRSRSFAAFATAFSAWRVTSRSFSASYAMAENVFAVTQTPLGAPPAEVPRSAVRQDRREPLLQHRLTDDTFVSSGRPVAGAEVRIVDAEGRVCADREPGEIHVRSTSLFGGYVGASGHAPSPITADGWYGTGDYGFVNGSELFVIGRLKDLVIVGGQNIFPEDVEMLIGDVAGIHRGRVVAFGVEDEERGTQSLAVVAETAIVCDDGVTQKLEREIRALVLAGVGIAPRYVKVVPPHWIVKSTAGKIARAETRERFLATVSRA